MGCVICNFLEEQENHDEGFEEIAGDLAKHPKLLERAIEFAEKQKREQTYGYRKAIGDKTMEMRAIFDFSKEPLELGMRATTGATKYYTLDGEATPYTCDPNEVLVINEIGMEGDFFGLVKVAALEATGRIEKDVRVVEPNMKMWAMIEAKRAEELHVPPKVIDYPVTLVLKVTKYRIGGSV
jgi:hypothetical protein